MPYNRNYCRKPYRRFRGGRRNYKNTKTNRNRKLVTGKDEHPIFKYARYAGAVGQIAKTVSDVYKLVNAEAKYVDATGSGTQSSTLGINYLTAIGAGTTDQTRNGNSILGKDLQIHYTISMNSSATNTFFRIMIICDKQQDGADPTAGSILADPTKINSLLNKDFTLRFVNMKDITIPLSTSGNSSASGKIYLKVPWHIYYDGTGSTVSQFKENQIFLVMLSNEATNTPTINWYSRFNFYDN